MNSLEKNQLIHAVLIEVFQHDSKVQQEMSRGEATVSDEEFAADVLLFAEEVLMYPFNMMVFSIFLSLFGFMMMPTHPSIAAAFLALAGVLSLFTLIPPVLLFIAANSLAKSAGSINVDNQSEHNLIDLWNDHAE